MVHRFLIKTSKQPLSPFGLFNCSAYGFGLWLLGMDLGWPMALSHGSYHAPRCLDRAMVNQMATGTTQDIDLNKTLHTHARWLSVGPFG